MPYSVTKTIRFCYAHRLLNYEGDCARIHGHNAKLEIDVESPSLDSVGFVVEMGEIKKTMKGWIDANFDHALLLHFRDPLCKVLDAAGEHFVALPCNPTTENLAELLYRKGHELGINISEIRFWETPDNLAGYQKKTPGMTIKRTFNGEHVEMIGRPDIDSHDS